MVALILSQEKKEWGILSILVAGGIFFMLCVSRLETVIGFLKDIWGDLPVDRTLFVPLLKMLGISYGAEFTSNICTQAGQPALAGQVELFAKLSMIVLCLPCISYLILMLKEVL